MACQAEVVVCRCCWNGAEWSVLCTLWRYYQYHTFIV